MHKSKKSEHSPYKEPRIIEYPSDQILFDTQAKLDKVWKDRFPNGKLPDRLKYLLSEVRREYWEQYSKHQNALQAARRIAHSKEL